MAKGFHTELLQDFGLHDQDLSALPLFQNSQATQGAALQQVTSRVLMKTTPVRVLAFQSMS